MGLLLGESKPAWMLSSDEKNALEGKEEKEDGGGLNMEEEGDEKEEEMATLGLDEVDYPKEISDIFGNLDRQRLEAEMVRLRLKIRMLDEALDPKQHADVDEAVEEVITGEYSSPKEEVDDDDDDAEGVDEGVDGRVTYRGGGGGGGGGDVGGDEGVDGHADEFDLSIKSGTKGRIGTRLEGMDVVVDNVFKAPVLEDSGP